MTSWFESENKTKNRKLQQHQTAYVVDDNVSGKLLHNWENSTGKILRKWFFSKLISINFDEATMEIGCHGCLLIFRIHWPTFSFYKQVIYVWFAKGKQYISASNPPRIPPQTDKWTADQSSCTMHVYFECPFGWPFLLPRSIDYQISTTTKNAKFDNTAYLPTIDKSRTLYITYWEKQNHTILLLLLHY